MFNSVFVRLAVLYRIVDFFIGKEIRVGEDRGKILLFSDPRGTELIFFAINLMGSLIIAK